MRKRKGSSLISVIILMMFITTVGVATVSFTMYDIKMQNNESLKIENLYGAESGIEIAYEILLKSYDYAINVGLNEVDEELAKSENQNLSVDVLNNKVNEVFQKEFTKVLTSNQYSYNGDSGNLLDIAIDYQIYPDLNESKDLIFQPIKFSQDNKELNVETHLNLHDNKIEVVFTSRYLSINNNQQVGENERVVERKYTITVPVYQGSSLEENEDITIGIYPVYNQRLINVDGNGYLTGAISLLGNVQIKGRDQLQIHDVNYGKYANGVVIKDSDLDLNGNLLTNQTVNLNNNAIVQLTGNTYGRNVYIGKTGIADISMNNHLSINGEMIVENDLAINVDHTLIDDEISTVELNSFYGITDKNIEGVSLDNASNLAKKSSSIIVNSQGATVDIYDEAYISGIAYLDVQNNQGNKYATGESVAVKGNYLAYTTILPGYEDRVTLNYYNPLMLIDAIESFENNSANDKASYFVNVNNAGQLQMSSGGVRLPAKTYSAGAVVSQVGNNVEVNHSIIKVDDLTIKDKQKIYATEVFGMGKEEIYPTTCIDQCVKRTVENQIRWDESSFLKTADQFNKKYGYLVLNNNKDVSITIEKNVAGGHTVTLTFLDGTIKQAYNISSELLLITKGNVIIKEGVDLTGNIIAVGDLKVESSTQNTSLKYDLEVTKKIIASNYTDLENVFIQSEKISDATVNIVTGNGFDPSEDTDYNSQKYIKKGYWKLVK